MTDEELVRLSLFDRRHYDLLVERHRQPLLNFVYFKLLSNWDSAEDVVQETFLSAFIKLETFDSTRKFKTWIYRIAINAATNFYRKGLFEELDDYAFLSYSDPTESIERSIQVEHLKKVIKTLPEDKAKILDLYYGKEKDFKEISREIKKPIHEVKNRLHYAERMLLKNYYIDS